MDIDILNDDCLLYIFDFFNPTDWVTASKVCTRWEKLLESKWKKLTNISIETEYDERTSTYINIDELCSLIRLAGPFIKSIKLRNYDFPESDIVIKFGKFYYIIMDFASIKEMAEMLSSSCHNVSNIELKRTMFSLSAMFESNKNIKKVLVYNGDWNTIFSGIGNLDTVEECRMYCKSKYISDFVWHFPQVNKLMFSIEADTFMQADQIINKVLSNVRELKSLTLVVFVKFHNVLTYKSRALANLAESEGFSSIEKLKIVSRFATHQSLPFKDGIVATMISVCRNLRVVRLDHVDLGDAGADLFLALPKLEELHIDPVQKFSFQFLMPLNHLKRLTLRFDQNASFDFPTLCNAVNKMKALVKLEIQGLSEKQSLELTCTAVKKGIEEDRKVIIDASSSTSGILKIRKNDPFKPVNFFMPEIPKLKLMIGEQGKLYSEDVIMFVDNSLKKCEISKVKEMNLLEKDENSESDEEDSLSIKSLSTNELDSPSETNSDDGDEEMEQNDYMEQDDYMEYGYANNFFAEYFDENDWDSDNGLYNEGWEFDYY